MKSIYFFAVNRHQFDYFHKIAALIEKRGEAHASVTHLGRNWSFYIWIYLSSLCSDTVRAAARLRLRGYYQEHEKSCRLCLALRHLWYISIAALRYSQASALLCKNKPDVVVLWNGSKWHQGMIKQLAKAHRMETIFFENGGLPNTTTIDCKGVNAENSVPRTPEFYRSYQPVSNNSFSPDTKLEVREQKIQREEINVLGRGQRYIFVPFQVDSDTQILLHSPHIRNMKELWQLLDNITDNIQDDLVFVVKEHPSSINDYTALHNKNSKILFSTESTQKLIENAEQVWTINSSVGLEAILLGKPVVVLGDAFYAIPGVAESVRPIRDIACYLNNIPSFDSFVRDKFICYLRSEYYIPESWRSAGADHLSFSVEHIFSILNKSFE